jgi:glycosyltransferase involved in cell wall biosynthesis
MSLTISVVVPAYNVERTILETIESVQQQTFSDFEIIVIDDGSTDQTSEIVKSLEDERIKIFSYPNGGLPVARNRGISHATGKFIAFIDADDLWTSDKLELQLAALQQHPEAGVAYSWTSDFVDEQKENLYSYEPMFFEGNVLPNLLVKNFLVSGSNPLIRREAIESVGEFDPMLKSCEDWDFYLRLAAKWNFVVVPKWQILYRRSSTSMSSKVEIMETAALTVLERAFQTISMEYQYLKPQSFAWVFHYCAQQYLRYATNLSDVNQAGHRIWKAIRLYPRILFRRGAQALIWLFIKRWIIVQLP